MHPPMSVGKVAELDRSEFLSDAGQRVKRASSVHFVTTRYRLHPHDNRGSAYHAYLLERFNLLVKVDFPLFNDQTRLLCQDLQHAVCGRGKDRPCLRCYVSAICGDAYKVAHRELFDIATFLCIQVEGSAISLLFGIVHWFQVCCIIAARLHMTCTIRSSTVMFLHDKCINTLIAAALAKVSASGQDGHEQGVLLCKWCQPKHVATGKEKWPYVHGSLVAIRWNKLHVAPHTLSDSVDKHFRGHFRHLQFPSTFLHAGCIHCWTHDANPAVLACKSLEALEDRHAVVQRAAVDVQ
mmetsp:Transcript_33977/g.65761  ORF Transcript_33977/g.65761 Transcript_33977/m.65761 type:complete len:295 (+) Transcript_33977:171-1055(+)